MIIGVHGVPVARGKLYVHTCTTFMITCMFRRWWSDTVAAQWLTGTSRLDIYKIFSPFCRLTLCLLPLLQGRPDHLRRQHRHRPDRRRARLLDPGLHGQPAGKVPSRFRLQTVKYKLQ